MKYIRTKDGIYKIINEEECFYECKGNIFISKDIFHHKDKIADTIEELCDEFKVIKYGAYGKLNPHSLNDFKILKQHNNYPNAQIFGYIMWLDENNILQTKVVAKMNDKGELELL